MPSKKQIRAAKKAAVDFNEDRLHEAEEELAAMNTDKAQEWRQKADWSLMVLCRYAGRAMPADVRAEKEKLNRDKAYGAYARVYTKWKFTKRSYEKAVEDLKKFEVAHGFGEHRVLLNRHNLWRCL